MKKLSLVLVVLFVGVFVSAKPPSSWSSYHENDTNKPCVNSFRTFYENGVCRGEHTWACVNKTTGHAWIGTNENYVLPSGDCAG